MSQNSIRPITAGHTVVLSNSVFLFLSLCLLVLCRPPLSLTTAAANRNTVHLTWLARSRPRPLQDPAMIPSLDSNEPRVRRSTSYGAPSIAPDGSFVQPLAPASPPSRGISHTPPLPPTTSTQCARQSVDPLAEFSQDKSNFAATDRCLDAACSLFQFEIAEVCLPCVVRKGGSSALACGVRTRIPSYVVLYSICAAAVGRL